LRWASYRAAFGNLLVTKVQNLNVIGVCYRLALLRMRVSTNTKKSNFVTESQRFVVVVAVRFIS
jgi:hypothetical protein